MARAAKRRRRGYVIWGEDWHEGVIGIVASRLVERFNRPVVLIAGNEGNWKGSGRSLPAFDLHGALAACSQHLERFGGHRAAAGLAIDPSNLDAFAAAFAAHADACLAEDDLAPVTRIDAIVPGSALTLGLASELERLAPFGLGNPDVTLLVPACETVQPGVVGEGKHLRFRIRQGGRDAGSAIAFGLGPQLDRVDAARAPRHRLPAEGEPLERHRLAAARRPPALRHAPRATRSCASSSACSGRPARMPGRATRARSSPSSSSPRERSASSTSRRRSGRCWPRWSVELPRAA